ncbi:MAG: RagB/SusD family nutrient uptake outer membrane protein [Porphyromonadaceae bacterium]|nr:RagB/SusD family nutrient uptake outer membrane protein [Porphyromonadaceae bacterium]
MKKYITIITIIFSIHFIGCENYLSEDGAPKLNYDYYSTSEGIDAIINAGYSYLRWGCGGENMTILDEMGTDLFTEGSDGSNKAAFNQYGSQLNPDNGILKSMWENHYKGISNSNIAIQQIEGSSLLESLKKEKTAEVQFIRAYLYFDLVQQFGKIPLVTKGSTEVNTSFKRAPLSDIYAQIISDLREAEASLPKEVGSSMKGKATAFAAAHLLSKVYLTRASAITDNRGQKPSDLDSALHYSEKVIKEGPYQLLENYSDLWDINNMGNKEVIFSVQFTSNPIFNGGGNKMHLYWTSLYEDLPGMLRDIYNGRPYRRLQPTAKVYYNLYDRKNDSRFYKSFRWVLYANEENSIPKWQILSDNSGVYFTPDPAKGQIAGSPKFAIGDTAVYYTVDRYNLSPNDTKLKKILAERYYTYMPYDMYDLAHYPILLKHLAPNRPSVAETSSSREWVRMRLGETYLIAAEAAGRKKDYDLAATYINKVRERAAWHDSETKMSQYWAIEGGAPFDTHGTYNEMMVSATSLASGAFIEFLLDERARELLGEVNRWEDLVRCEKLYEWVKEFNKGAKSIQSYHKLRPIPQSHIDRLIPAGDIKEEQNEGYY